MTHRLYLLLMMLCIPLLAATSAVAADDVMEKIRQLEQQIQELKLLKEQQTVVSIKYEHCMKAVAREKFCTCISSSLPREISFEQYIHTVITPRDTLGYDSMASEQKKLIDSIIAVREKCVEKGFFK